MARSPKSVRHLLKDKPTLRFLGLEISARKALLDRVCQLLPGDLAPHCLAAQLRGPLLTLHTESPVWATRLRFLAPQLRVLLQPDYPALRDIRIRIVVNRAPPPKAPRTARKSDTASGIIHDTAMHTKQDELREALLRLSKALKN